MNDRPSGPVAFLFTDLEGSTRYWERRPHEMPAVYARHDAILRAAIGRQGGVVYKVIGDAFQVAFPNADGALTSAIEAQRRLLAEPWPISPAPRVRMALHLVEVSPEPDGDYRTPGLNRLGRLLAAGDGGQILLTDAMAKDVHPDAEVEIIDLGEHRFRDLSPQRVHQVVAPGLPTAPANLRSLTAHKQHLPNFPTPFIGRVDVLERADAALRDSSLRLMTLLGPGGIGKSRLAVEIASRVVDHFSDGVWFIALAPISDPDLVLPAVASLLGVRESVDQTVLDALSAHLAQRHTLLLLDNVEQVIGAAPDIATLLARCPRVVLLATSRIPLGISGEREFPVSPLGLPLPDAQRRSSAEIEALFANEAVQLFADRTRAIRPSFTVTSENVAAIVAICERLDGLPLAIELAAARGRLLSPAQLLTRLESRLPLLTRGPRDLPARQQTLRGAIDWSFELLDPREQRFFSELAVFVGGATLEAIETVCGHDQEASDDSIFDAIESLARQSLLNLDDATSRVQMLETIREYAAERLLQSDLRENLAGRHACYYLELAEEAEPRLSAFDQVDWLDALALEHDNLRAALSWLHDSRSAVELARLSGALWRFWWIRGHLTEGREWLARAIDLAETSSLDARILARLLDGAGALAESQGDIDRAVDYHERASSLWTSAADLLGQARSLENLGIIALHDRSDVERARALHQVAHDLYVEAGDRPGIASSLKNLGDVALAEEAFPQASAFFTRALVIARELQDTRGIATALTSLGALAFLMSEPDRAALLFEESLPLWRILGDVPGLALTLGNLGEAFDHLGSADRAKPLYEESLALSREIGDKQGIAFCQSHLGRIARQDRNIAVAAGHYTECAELCRDIEDFARLAECVEGLAGALADDGEAARAASLYGVAHGIRRSTGSPLKSVHLAAYERDLSVVRTALAEGRFDAIFQKGAESSLQDQRAKGIGPDMLVQN